MFERTNDAFVGLLAKLVKKRINLDSVIESIDKRGKHGKKVRISKTFTEDLKTFTAKLPKYTSPNGREIKPMCWLWFQVQKSINFGKNICQTNIMLLV